MSLHLRICCQNQNALRPFLRARPRQLILAVHSKAISEYEADKGSAPHPFRACFLIRGGARLSSPPQAGGAGGLFIPGGAVSARWERCSRGVREPDGGGKWRERRGRLGRGKARGPCRGCGGAGRGWRTGRRLAGRRGRASEERREGRERAGGARGCGGQGARCLGPASQVLTSSAGGGAVRDAGCPVITSLRGPSLPFPLRCSFPT